MRKHISEYFGGNLKLQRGGPMRELIVFVYFVLASNLIRKVVWENKKQVFLSKVFYSLV